MRSIRRWAAPLALLAAVAGLSLQFTKPAPVAQAAAYNSSASSTLTTYLQRGQAFAGLGPDTSYLWQEFNASSSSGGAFDWFQAGVNSGSLVTNLDGVKGGVFRLSTGAGAASSETIDSRASVVAGQGTDTWYVAVRFRIQTAVTAQTVAGAGLRDSLTSVKTIQAGFFGALNGSNFGVQHSGTVGAGSFLNFSVAVDTNFHVAEIYVRAGDGTVRARLDGGAEVSAALSSPPTSSSEAYVVIQNGTDAVNRNLDLDWMLVLSGRS